MDLSPIPSIIYTVTIGTMLDFSGGNNGRGLKTTCKQILKAMIVFMKTFTLVSFLRIEYKSKFKFGTMVRRLTTFMFEGSTRLW